MTPESQSTPSPLILEDIIRTDTLGRARNPNGSMMKNVNKWNIEAHLDQITEGLGGYDTLTEKFAADAASKTWHDRLMHTISEHKIPEKLHTSRAKLKLGAIAVAGAIKRTVAANKHLPGTAIDHAKSTWAKRKNKNSIPASSRPTRVISVPLSAGSDVTKEPEAVPDAPSSETMKPALSPVEAPRIVAVSRAVSPSDLQRYQPQETKPFWRSPNKLNTIMMGAGAWIVAARTHRERNTLPDEKEKKDDRKAAIGLVVLGIGALALTTYLAREGIHMPGSGGGATKEVADNVHLPSNPTLAPPQQEIIPGQVLELKPVSSEHTEHMVSVLTDGQNPWSESVDYARSLGMPTDINNQADVQFIDAVKDQVLRINEYSEDEATRLDIGTRLRMPSAQRMTELYERYTGISK